MQVHMPAQALQDQKVSLYNVKTKILVNKEYILIRNETAPIIVKTVNIFHWRAV